MKNRINLIIPSILWLSLIPLTIHSCKGNGIKIENPPISQGNMFACHMEMAWDSMMIKNTLIGEWEWKYIGCCCLEPGNANSDEYKGLVIEFKSDNSLKVKEAGQIIQSSNWKLANNGIDFFEISSTPFVTQLGGRILICDDIIEFNASYRDLCDNYFERKE